MATREKRRFRPNLAALSGLVALASGCSVLFHADANQCSSNTDCAARGAAFANDVCQAGTCIASPLMANDGGVDASQSKDASVETSIDAAVEAEAEAGPPRCKTNDDCMPDPTHIEVACDRGTGACLQLTTDECPLTIGKYDDPANAPIFLGAFAELPPSGLTSHPSFINYKMAIDEFKDGIPGVDPVKKIAGLRMPVVVVCNGSGDVNVAMTHLQGDLHVPAVIAALDAASLRTMFANIAYPAQTFVINPFGADSKLTALTTQAFGASLLWHMLGQPGDTAPAYAAFFPHYESYVRTKQSLTAPTRVATVTGDATVTNDLRGEVSKVLRYNGMSLAENFNANPSQYMDISMASVLDPTVDPAGIDYSDAITKLLAFKPNIIVSFAGPEFATLFQKLELQWAPSASNPSPYYLLGPYNSVSQGVIGWINAAGNSPNGEARRTRFAGIGVASASDTHVLDAYRIRFPGPSDALGQENYYDAMYFALYSLVGAGSFVSPAGPNLAQGMLRLLSGNSYDMGPGSAQGSIFGTLGTATGTISLFGTLGPPNFTLRTGARLGEGSVYCVSRVAGSPVYTYDVQRVSGTTDDAGAPGLAGSFSCYSGL